MRILSLSALFPPHSHGGAENSAANLARWYAEQGHDVHVLSASIDDTDTRIDGEPGVRPTVWRKVFPRPYPVFSFPSAPSWQKPLWHAQDTLDWRNKGIVGRLLDELKPDVALIHYVPGIGYNTLGEFGRRDIPAVYYLHDLGLLCNRMSMFRDGHDCTQQCTGCRWGSKYKASLLRSFRRLGLVSPSRATLDRVLQFFPLQGLRSTVIPNARRYAPPTVARTESEQLRLLYVGRLHGQKGVEVALAAVQRQLNARIQVRIVGGGQLESELRQRFGGLPWVSFTGQIPDDAIADEMANADVLLVPSVWQENLPGVIIQALGLGIPVLGSRIGGIPELVSHGENGLLVEPGDVDAWSNAVARIASEPGLLDSLRQGARAGASRFDPEALGLRHLEFLRSVMAAP